MLNGPPAARRTWSWGQVYQRTRPARCGRRAPRRVNPWPNRLPATESVVSEWSFRLHRSIMGRMALDPAQLQQAAKDHLWMHFTRHSSYREADVPVIVRGEGAYIWDINGK